MPSIAALPQELVDHIIDDIGPSDKRAAASLTLTCHAWTPRSSKHLFDTVNIFTTELPDFLAQAAGSSRLASHVAELTISQPMRGDDGFDLTPFVPAILRTLPRLSALSVFGERVSVQAGLPAAPAAQRRALALLRLSHTHIEALPELLQLFGAVDTLQLDQVYIPPCATGPPPPPARHLRVRALFFDGSRPTFEALTALLQRGVLQYLHLKCDMFFRIHTEPVNAFLHEVGAALEHFRFDLPMDGWVVDGPEKNDLAALHTLRRLRTLELVSPRRAIRRRGTTVARALWANMLRALAHAPPGVAAVRLSVNLYHVAPRVLAELDPAPLAAALACAPALAALEIRLTTERDGAVVPVGADKAAEVLPAVRARLPERLGRILTIT